MHHFRTDNLVRRNKYKVSPLLAVATAAVPLIGILKFRAETWDFKYILRLWVSGFGSRVQGLGFRVFRVLKFTGET